MTALSSRVGDLEREMRWSSSCDRNTNKWNISEKRKLLGNKSESDQDSDIELSNEETLHLLIPDTQPSTSKELDKLLSHGDWIRI